MCPPSIYKEINMEMIDTKTKLGEGGKYMRQFGTGRIFPWHPITEKRDDMTPFIYKGGKEQLVEKLTTDPNPSIMSKI